MSTVYFSNSSFYDNIPSWVYAANLSHALHPSDSPHGVEGGARLAELLGTSWKHGRINAQEDPS